MSPNQVIASVDLTGASEMVSVAFGAHAIPRLREYPESIANIAMQLMTELVDAIGETPAEKDRFHDAAFNELRHLMSEMNNRGD